MRIPVSLGGCNAAWRFFEGGTFEEWLDGESWIADGGLKTLRIPSSAYFSRFSEVAKGLLLASVGGRHDIRIDSFEYPSLSLPEYKFEELMFARLNIREEATGEYMRLCEAATIFEAYPSAFLVHFHERDARDRVAEANGFLERIEKVGGKRLPLVIGFASTYMGPFKASINLLRGYPESLHLCNLDIDDDEVWRRYVHQRVAWESCGELSRSEEWEQRYSFRKLPFGNDDLLENRLNQAAADEFAEVDDLQRQKLRQFAIDCLGAGGTSSKALTVDLEHRGLICDHRGLHKTIVSPWVARALIRERFAVEAKASLSASLVCLPIASELLAHCFMLETQERALCSQVALEGSLAKQETRDAYAKYLDRHVHSEAEYYPVDCPASPDNVWQFASFGEILHHAPTRDWHRADDRHKLRRLRNSLSHGHYVSWRMLVIMRQLLLKLV